MDLLDHSGGAASPRSLPPGHHPQRRAPIRFAGADVRLDALADAVAAPLAALRGHRVWRLAARPEALRALMEHHVFCVWDFMSLVKALQAELTCTTVPWVPRGTPALRRFVNEIVLDEESDEIAGEPLSHFELYLRAMAAMQADTRPARAFVAAVADGASPPAALRRAGAPAPAARFVAQTLDVVARARVWQIAAAFTFGREEAIPAMFAELVRSLPGRGRCAAGRSYDSGDLRAYLERHIDVDAGKHAPLARRLVAELCGDDAQRWREARAAALAALAARHALWDAVAARIEEV
jgi:hypothetical protein